MEAVSGELVAVGRKKPNTVAKVAVPSRSNGEGGIVRRVRAVASAGAGGFGPYVPRETMARIFETVGPETQVGLLLRVLWQSGARISEALALRVSDIDFGRRTLRLQTLKRRKGPDGTAPAVYRLVPIQSDLVGYLGRHLGLYRLAPEERIWIWCRRWAAHQITGAMLAAGCPRELAHPHAIRHGHAVAAILAGVPLPALQAQLGHSSIAVTSIYLRLTIQDRIEAYQGVF
jgi:integrase